ncbi:hypothetical protein ACLOJK_019597 [Asimina triloba]
MGGSLNSKLALTSLRPYLVSADGSPMDATRRDREIAPGSAWSSAMDSPFQFVSRPPRELLPFGSGRHRHRLVRGLSGTRCHSPSARGELLPFGSGRHRRHLFRDLSGTCCPSPLESSISLPSPSIAGPLTPPASPCLYFPFSLVSLRDLSPSPLSLTLPSLDLPVCPSLSPSSPYFFVIFFRDLKLLFPS